VATTAGGGSGAVRVSGAPSGGVSGAGAAADDVGSVIDFLSGAGVGARLRCIAGRSRYGFDEQIYSTPVASAVALRSDHTLATVRWCCVGGVCALLAEDVRVDAP
jgi:hypothetical protein